MDLFATVVGYFTIGEVTAWVFLTIITKFIDEAS